MLTSHSIRAITVAAICCTAALAAHAQSRQIAFSSSDDLAGWVFEYEQWLVRDGALTQLPVISSARGSRIWMPQRVYGDFELSIEFRHAETQHPSFGGLGVLYRAASGSEYHSVSLDVRPERRLAVLTRQSQPRGPTRTGKVERFEFGKWHTLKIVAKGPSHEIFLDGELVAAKSDASLPSGAIGLEVDRVPVEFRNLRITGRESSPSRPFQVRTLPYVTVASDAGPGYEYAGFPDVVKAANGDLVCVFYAGYKHVPSGPNERLPKGGAIAMTRSTDEGITWSKPVFVYDSPMDDHDPGLSLLSDGKLALTACCWPCEGHHKPHILWSHDHGQTWSEASRLDAAQPVAKTEVPYNGRIIEMSDGSLMMATYGTVKQSEDFCSVIIRRSTDKGNTWVWSETGVIRSPLTEGHDRNLWEPGLIRFSDGRILMIARQMMWSSESIDDGRTWSTPVAMQVRGDAPFLFMTSKNILLCGIRSRGNPRGTAVLYSLDEGRTWSDPVEIAPVIGAYTGMAELSDGRIFVVYYTESVAVEEIGGLGSDVRGAFLEVTQHGITVLDGPK